ncbi:transcriptional regulator [Saccharicrinis carchari]|uniref:Transcriptional regulator n=1 Tax=Saccharicrinis carchari TaxID=1168039 RepID=A0A521D5X6_SACCC|nr:DUF6377 domain-containing protein [Saccharicrinis carchari]SMO66501.1 transcriptional regulator [Saccharicrinis carchari]
MNKILILFKFLLGASTLSAHSEVDSLVVLLEKTMEEAPVYEQKKINRIASLKNILAERQMSPEETFFVHNQLIEEYLKYNFDSTLHYLNLNQKLARELGNPKLQNQSNIKMAFVLASSGRYFEAVEKLERIDKSTLADKGLIDYYNAFIKVYNDLSFYTPSNQNRQKYTDIHNNYIDSLLPLLNPESPQYLSMLEKQYRDQRNMIECKKINSRRLSNAQMGTIEYSLITFERALLFELENNIRLKKKYLILSAISDIKAAVKDNASLTDLALILNDEGDVFRAHRFIMFSFDDASFYNSRLRFMVISEILPVISNAYQIKTTRQQKTLRQLLTIISVLLVILLMAIFFIHRQLSSLKKAQGELKKVNAKLKSLNQSLNESNNQLNAANDALAEANHVKEHYIGNFLTICSNYIDKLDEMNKVVNKKIGARQFEELFRLTKSKKLIDSEVQEFYKNFDDTFLHIFPHFVEQLNALLTPEEQIVLKDEERLNTELRIFALIRLGINDSSKIAKLLRYSVNTIYNYRVKIKNKARTDRDNFENSVMLIDVAKK